MKLSKRAIGIFLWILPIFSLRKVAWAQYSNWGYGGWGMGPGMMGWGNMGWFGFVFMMIFWVLLIVLVVLLVRRLLLSGHTFNRDYPRGESALEILKKRYARGEIDKEEFESRKKDLS